MNYKGGTGNAIFNLTSPQVAQFTVNPDNSTANVLRGIMFLDAVDLLVVGTVEGFRFLLIKLIF
jgi:hypothetical protein